jgi:hypothetical protein
MDGQIAEPHFAISRFAAPRRHVRKSRAAQATMLLGDFISKSTRCTARLIPGRVSSER